MATHHEYQRIVPFILFVLALILLFKLIQPMIIILLGSILLAYITFPLYKRIGKKINSKSISIIISLSIVAIVILIPFSFLAFEMTQQGYYFYNSLSASIEKGALFGFGCISADSKICSLLNRAEKFSLERFSAFGFDKQLQKFLPTLQEKITHFIISIPIIIAQVLLTIVISYFILKDWKKIVQKTVNLLPMRTTTIKKLIQEFKNISNTVIYAQLFVALIQGIIG